jgi:hypothetical protein
MLIAEHPRLKRPMHRSLHKPYRVLKSRPSLIPGPNDVQIPTNNTGFLSYQARILLLSSPHLHPQSHNPTLISSSILASSACLHLLGSPAAVSLTHVLWRLNGGDEFEDAVSDTDYANHSSKDDIKDVGIKEDGANKDVDFEMSAGVSLP